MGMFFTAIKYWKDIVIQIAKHNTYVSSKITDLVLFFVSLFFFLGYYLFNWMKSESSLELAVVWYWSLLQLTMIHF